MAEAVAPRPGPDDTNPPDQQVKVHRSETKTRTPVEAKREGPTLDVVTGEKHAQTGALLAKDILIDLGFPLDEVATMMGAVANHEEDEGGLPVSAVSAAVIIADKSDVHRSRVRNPKSTSFDIHDRVNYAVTASEIKVSRKEKLITLELAVDTEVSPIMEYFEIFLPRMMLSRRAAEFLHCNFALVINNTRLL